MEGAALSVSFLPSGVSISATIFFTHSALSTWLLSFTWTATMVLPCWSAEATFVMASDATGVLRLENTTTATRIATKTPAISNGTIGGSVHLALSNSSVIGTWPASGLGPALAGFSGDGVGVVFSGISSLRKQHTPP